MKRFIAVLPVGFCIFMAALFWGCTSPVDYFMEHTAPVRIVDGSGPGALTALDGAMIVAEGEAVITVTIANPRHIALTASLDLDPGTSGVSAVLGSFNPDYTQITIDLTGADSGDAFDLTLALESADGLREFRSFTRHCICTENFSAGSGGLVKLPGGDYYGFVEAIAALSSGSPPATGTASVPVEVALATDIILGAPLNTGSTESYIRLVPQGGDRRISAEAGGMNHLIGVRPNVTLYLGEPGSPHKLIIDGQGQGMSGSLVDVAAGGAVEMYDGVTITRNRVNTSAPHGVGVYVGGEFTMYGGTISGNIGTTVDAGGVYVRNTGTFTMEGGIITGNTGQSGGGVRIDGGTFIMNGGTITGNSAGAGGGGGVYNQGTFTMNGGVISNNRALNNLGGGVCSHSNFTKLGGVIYGAEAGANSNRASANEQGHAVWDWTFSPYWRDTTQ